MGNCAAVSSDDLRETKTVSLKKPKAVPVTSSGIHLRANIYTKLYSTDDNFEEETKISSKATFNLHYLVTYCGKQIEWSESCVTEIHKSQPIHLEYMLGHADQSLTVLVTQQQQQSQVTFDMHSLIDHTLAGQLVKPSSVQKKNFGVRMKC
jgi:hypothetical protein